VAYAARQREHNQTTLHRAA